MRISYANATGETLASTEQSVVVAANKLLTIIPGVPAGYGSTYRSISGIRTINIYVGASSGAETLQAGLAYPNFNNSLHGWTEPNSGLVSGAALPATNTTHQRTKYGIYHLQSGYIGAGANMVESNHIFGTINALGSNLTSDSAQMTGNYFNDVRLPDSQQAISVITVSSNTTLDGLAATILANAAAGALTVMLPSAVGVTGRHYTIKRINSGSNNVIVGTTSSQTIDGASTRTLGAQWSVFTVVSDGSAWQIVNQAGTVT